MEIGEVKVADDADFERLIQMCQHHEGWNHVYQKGLTNVWTKSNDVCDFNMIKVIRKFFLLSISD